MARRVFFSFHIECDVWQASVVRAQWVKGERHFKDALGVDFRVVSKASELP